MKRMTILLALGLVACGGKEEAHETPKVVEGVVIGKPVPTHPKRIGDFTLEAAAQGTVSKKDLEGKVWIGSTMFTHCPTICPALTISMAEMQNAFKGAEDFRLVSISVDPKRDTAEVLKKFGAGYGADEKRWYFTRHDDIKTVGKFVTNVLYLPWFAPDPLNHAKHIALIGRDGTVRGMWDGTDPDEVEKLEAAIRETLAEKKNP